VGPISRAKISVHPANFMVIASQILAHVALQSSGKRNVSVGPASLQRFYDIEVSGPLLRFEFDLHVEVTPVKIRNEL